MFLHIGSQREVFIRDLIAIVQDEHQPPGSLVITAAQTLPSPISVLTLHKRLREIAALLSGDVVPDLPKSAH